jgi:phosphopantothenate-cysteine ligase
LVTAGGTAERIDPVRVIANAASGRLGRLVAEGFLAGPEPARVTYVAPRAAERPAGVDWLETTDAASLEAVLRHHLSRHRVDAIVHSMAVGDYRVRTVTTAARLAQDLADRAEDSPQAVAAALRAAPGLDRDHKLSSRESELVLLLEPTPKIIAGLAGLAPGAVLVGFKLLSQAAPEALRRAALELMADNHCDFVLANDLADITGDRHIGQLIDRAGNSQRFTTKAAIAAGIVAAVRRAVAERDTASGERAENGTAEGDRGGRPTGGDPAEHRPTGEGPAERGPLRGDPAGRAPEGNPAGGGTAVRGSTKRNQTQHDGRMA